MRLFIAINFTAETRRRLIALREELRSHIQTRRAYVSITPQVEAALD